MTSADATVRSICTIWPIFSSKVIRLIKSLIRTFNGCFGSLYFRYSASVQAAQKHKRRSPIKEMGVLAIFLFANCLHIITTKYCSVRILVKISPWVTYIESIERIKEKFIGFSKRQTKLWKNPSKKIKKGNISFDNVRIEGSNLGSSLRMSSIKNYLSKFKIQKINCHYRNTKQNK